jgi:hypothetical protein
MNPFRISMLICLGALLLAGALKLFQEISRKSIPRIALIFTFLGITLSIGTFLLVNFRRGLSYFFMIELGRKMTAIPTHDDYIFLLQFVVGGLLFSLIFSIHWYVYAGLSRYIKSITLTGIFGVIILIGDAYIRIQSVFFAKHSTDPIAIAFIPVIIGGPALIVYSLLGFRGSKTRRVPPAITNSNNSGTARTTIGDKKRCTNCGADIKTIDKFCMMCGKQLAENAVLGTQTK